MTEEQIKEKIENINKKISIVSVNKFHIINKMNELEDRYDDANMHVVSENSTYMDLKNICEEVDKNLGSLREELSNLKMELWETSAKKMITSKCILVSQNKTYSN